MKLRWSWNSFALWFRACRSPHHVVFCAAMQHWQIPIVWTINDWKPKLRRAPKALRHQSSPSGWISDASTPPASIDGPLIQQVHACDAALLRHMKDLFRRHRARKLTSYPCKWAVNPLPLQSTCLWKNAWKKSPVCNYHSSTIRQKPYEAGLQWFSKQLHNFNTQAACTKWCEAL